MPNTALNRTVASLLTNKSGGALAYGDVVILGTATASAFTTTTTGALSTTQIGVILEPNGIANNAIGLVATAGWVPKINLNTAATIYQFLKTHTVAGQATPHASPQVEGDFAIALTASATPEAILFGSPNAPGLATSPAGSTGDFQKNTGGAFAAVTPGAGVAAAFITAIGSPGAPVLFNGAGGTPSSIALAAGTGLPATTGLITVPAVIEGRLTTESGVPVSASDRTAQGTIYWKPCLPDGTAKTNGMVALYNGSAVIWKSITQVTLAITITSGKIKNVYLDFNSGTPQLVLGADWTNDTTPSETLADQGGLVVLSGTPAYRYVGWVGASGSNVTEDSAANRFLGNAYNQVPRTMRAVDTTDSWNYTTSTYREARGQTTNQLNFIVGTASAMVEATAVAMSTNGTGGVSRGTGIGIDSTTTPAGSFNGLMALAGNQTCVATYRGSPGIGKHYLAWLEFSDASGTTTWFGDAGGAFQSGITGTIWN